MLQKLFCDVYNFVKLDTSFCLLLYIAFDEFDMIQYVYLQFKHSSCHS